MRNWLFVVFFFVTGCYTVQPSTDYCDELCGALEEGGCSTPHNNCRSECAQTWQEFSGLGCEQQLIEYSECQLSHEQICEVSTSTYCAPETDALDTCLRRSMCVNACDAREVNGCGAEDCVSDCEGLSALAQETGCAAAWTEWVSCEEDSRSCGECLELENAVQGCVVGLVR